MPNHAGDRVQSDLLAVSKPASGFFWLCSW